MLKFTPKVQSVIVIDTAAVLGYFNLDKTVIPTTNLRG